MNAVHHLRAISIVEGISYLALVLVAMPLKYLFDTPGAVRIVGALHGLLFLIFVLLWVRAVLDRSGRLGLFGLVGLASLLPFGFLFVDKRLREEASRPV